MAHFVVSFRIERNTSYQERYDSLKEKVEKIAQSYVWDETTSLYVFKATGTAHSIAYDLYYGTKINTSMGDVIIVVDPHNSACSGYGVNYPTLLSDAIGMAVTK